MKIDFNNPKVRKTGGILFIIVAMALVCSMIFHFVKSDDTQEVENQNVQQTINDAEREAMLNELEHDANDAKDIESEKAKKIMQLNVEISDEILNLYLNGDKERLYTEIENFLVEYDFYDGVTKAVCTGVVTKDYKKNKTYLEFALNDSARTTLTVEYRDSNGKYDLNFY